MSTLKIKINLLSEYLTELHTASADQPEDVIGCSTCIESNESAGGLQSPPSLLQREKKYTIKSCQTQKDADIKWERNERESQHACRARPARPARGSLSAVTLNHQSIDEQQRRPFNDLACSQAGVYEAAISGTML